VAKLGGQVISSCNSARISPRGTTMSLVQRLYLCQSTRTFRENRLSFKLQVIGLLHAKNTDAVCNERTP
jgi:hypothetical protein